MATTAEARAIFKRYRLEIQLSRAPAPPALPLGFRWVPWFKARPNWHADTLRRSFLGTPDAILFPCLASRTGAQLLMAELCAHRKFIAQATWLIESPDDFVGTIQGLGLSRGMAMVQNVGVTPDARNLGLGSCLVLRALEGFRLAGFQFACLEVTAENHGALRLYRRLGFYLAGSMQKEADPRVYSD